MAAEGTLADGETHVYKIPIPADNYLRLVIRMGDGNIQSRLLAPGGSTDIGAAYHPDEPGKRVVSLVTDAAGSYRLELRLVKDIVKAERYEVKIEELRPATEQDRLRVAAEKVEGEGFVLLHPSNPVEQRRQGIAKYEEALQLWRQLGERKDELRMLAFIGIKYRDVGEPQMALVYARQAIETARAMGERYQEANLTITFAILYRSLGENQKALDYFHQARQQFKALSARFGEAIAVSHIGATFAIIGELQMALQYFKEALTVYSSVGDTGGTTNLLNAMGAVHRKLGDPRTSIELHTRALELARANQDTLGESASLVHLGNAYLDSGDRQKALAFAEQGVNHWRALGDPFGEGDALKLVGDLAYLSGDYPKALDALNQSYRLFHSTWERPREASALHSLAQVNFSMGNFDEARKQLEMALEIQESLRANVINQQLRETLFTSAQRSFALYIDLLMRLHESNPSAGHDRAALQVSERARARSLLELLAESQADIRRDVPKNLLETERSLQQQINAKAARRTALLSDKRTQAQAAAYDKEITELTSRYRDVEVQIRQHSPRYAALSRPQPLTTTEIQQQLDNHTVLLEFALGDKQSWLWAVTRSTVTSYRLPPGSQIDPAARRVYELLIARQPKKGESEAHYHLRIADADSAYRTESAALSQMLIGPIAARLQQEWKGKRLAIVASGLLEYLPFAALPDPAAETGRKGEGEKGRNRSALPLSPSPLLPFSPTPLIVGHEIVSLPSASALSAIRSESTGRKPAEKMVAVLADPVFEPTDARLLEAARHASGKSLVASVRSASDSTPDNHPAQSAGEMSAELMRSAKSFTQINERGGFTRLPFSREEAEAIASLVPNTSLMKATDFQASRAVATGGELRRYRILHFATHGLLNSEHPELSGLVLSLVDPDGKPLDGFLRMHEIYNLNLPADLVVLSACQTALGKQIRGEGVIGLTRGFMYAGAQRVVASLWQVDDLATAQLMKSFYRRMLKDGLRPAAALRAAQLDLLAQKRWSSPYFWAAFTLQGEWQ